LARTPFPNTQVRAFGVAPNGDVVLGILGDLRFYKAGSFLPGSSANEPYLTLKGAGSAGIAVSALSFSRDGKRLAVSLIGGKVSVWDLESQQAIGSSFSSALTAQGVLSPDGKSLLVSNGDAMVYWSLDAALWFDKACFAAGRNLTEAEWAKYFPGREYEVTCPQWPAKPKT
jgi:WD40 repeat protein